MDGHNTIMIRYDEGADVAEVLRRLADSIVNGRIRCTGIERRVKDGEEEDYWVKDCGEYEVLVTMPVGGKSDLVYDVDGRSAMVMEVRKKRV